MSGNLVDSWAYGHEIQRPLRSRLAPVTPPATPVRVLLVEDSDEAAVVLANELRRGGYEPAMERVVNRADFLSALARPRDIVIAHYALPGFGGLDVLAALQEHGLDLPALVTSDGDGDDELREAMRAGARDYILKGNLARLVPAVRRELREAAVRKERRATERALRESEERFRFLVEHTGDLLYRLRFGNMTYDYMSPGMERLTGYSLEEINAMGFASIVVSLSGPAASHVVRQELREDRRPGQGYEFWADYQIRTRSGELRWLADHSLPWYDEEGTIRGSIGILSDITRRKEAEEALRLSEARLRTILDAALDAVIGMDQAGAITYWNPRAEAIFGWPRAEAVGRTVRDLIIPAKYRDHHASGLQRFLESGEGPVLDRRLEMEGLRRDGTVFPLELVVTAIRQGGSWVFNAFAADISERKRAEEALRTSEEQLRQSQKMEAVGRLAGGVAHDFNNLITAITGYAELTVRRMDTSDPRARNLYEIMKAAERAASLTRQLLAFGRKQVLQPRVLDLGETLDQVDRLLRRLIGEDVELVTLKQERRGCVRADPTQLEQVVMNLAINARDAMPRGGRLTLEVRDVELDLHLDQSDWAEQEAVTPGRYVLLAVTDTGHGMDRETQSHIFEPFFTTKEVGLGTGLGLSTVYGIVKQSGGYVAVESQPGVGTTFRVYLPRVEEPADPIAPPLAPAVARTGSETILLVEDDDAIRDMLREILVDEGYTVLTTSSPDDALRSAAAHPGPIHIMVSDVVMPGMTGPELAAEVLPLRPGLKILFMSGYTSGMVEEGGLLDDPRRFLQKPFTADAFATKVREVLET